jgi:peptidyl-prolyl cis-trans isomerase C
MQKIHQVKCVIIAALVVCGTFVNAAEPDAKKEISPAPVAAAPTAVLQGAVARVNGIEISAVELRRAKKMLLRGQTVPAEKQAEVDNQLIDQLIVAELLYQSGLKLEIKDIDKQVDERLAQDKKQFANEQDFAKALKELEMDDKILHEFVQRNLIINLFIEKTIASKVAVSEEETRKLLEEVKSKIKRQKVDEAVHAYIADAKKTAKIEKISNK